MRLEHAMSFIFPLPLRQPLAMHRERHLMAARTHVANEAGILHRRILSGGVEAEARAVAIVGDGRAAMKRPEPASQPIVALDPGIS